jgi:hypothetical protein
LIRILKHQLLLYFMPLSGAIRRLSKLLIG